MMPSIFPPKVAEYLMRKGEAKARESDPKVKVGDKIPVGEFFWIQKEDIIGHDTDARHRHGSMDGGSVDVGCTLTVRGLLNGYAVVRLDRPEMPCGAPAAIGTVFQIPLRKIATWPQKLTEKQERDVRREELAKKYCR